MKKLTPHTHTNPTIKHTHATITTPPKNTCMQQQQQQQTHMYARATTTTTNPTPRTIIGHSPHPTHNVDRMGIHLVLCVCLHIFITRLSINLIHVGIFLHFFSN